MASRRITIIVAASANGVIGVGSDLPWRLPEDMKFFKATTMGHHVVMGRKTWESLPKPLLGRTNVVVTRQRGFLAEGGVVVHGLDEALSLATDATDDEVFVIGGGELYAQALPAASRVYLTRVETEIDGDVFFRWEGGPDWQATRLVSQAADARHRHAFSIWRYDRIGP